MDGALEVELAVAGSEVRDARLLLGMVHRGAEKLMESRDYRAGLALADRHDWLGSICSEIGLAATIETAAGIIVPARAGLLRILLAELTRLGHHLAFLAPLPGAPGGDEPEPSWSVRLQRVRAEVVAAIAGATGARVHPAYVTVGGVRADLTQETLDGLSGAVPRWGGELAELLDAPLAAILAGYHGIGRLTQVTALGLGATGQVGRASGIDLDLRRDSDVLAYPAAVLAVPTSEAGDAAARVDCLAREVPVSLAVIQWVIAELATTPGPVAVRLPKVLRVPPGQHYRAFENPSGVNGYLLISRNEPSPYRLKIRSSGLGNAAALQAALPGTAIAAVPAVLASFFLLSGDIDR